MKKKIGLYLSEELSGGGKFQYSLCMLEAMSDLPNEEYEVVVAYTHGLWLNHLNDYKFRHFHISRSSWDRIVNKIWQVMRFPPRLVQQLSPHIYSPAKTLLKEHRDLWIFPSHEALTYQVPVPSLSAMHDLMHRYECHFPEVLDHNMYKKREWAYGNICKWAKGLLVDSKVGKQQVIDSYRIPSEKIHVLPFIPPKYIYTKYASDGFEKRYTLPSKFIFYPACFWEHKNHKGFIQAAALLKDAIPDLHIVFVGSKKEGYQGIHELVEKFKLTRNIHFLGYVPDIDMPEFYRRARAMIMPTFFGPTNIPPLEAIALGCPAAVSDIYGAREQMGDVVLYFNPLLPQEIAATIKQLWEDDHLCTMLSKRGLLRSAQWNQTQFNQRLRKILEYVIS
jgi:glycosyltransferase involved in cell wall biosynthesis